jgi:hypothetical protein
MQKRVKSRKKGQFCKIIIKKSKNTDKIKLIDIKVFAFELLFLCVSREAGGLSECHLSNLKGNK